MASTDLAGVENFGAVDADADALLAECFATHSSYESVRDTRKFLVLGRKGSGKTAIYKQLLVENATSLSQGYTFDDYPWHHHDLQAEVGVPPERRFVHSWKYLILLNLAKILLNKDQSQPWSDESAESIEKIENFVVDSYGTRNPDTPSLFRPQQKLKITGRLDLKFVSLEGSRLSMPDLPRHIQDLNRAMQNHVIRSLNPEIRYFICFDQLDLGFSDTDGTYNPRLEGSLMAAKDLFVEAKEQGKKFVPAIFLRDDIYQELAFEDKNKITENYATKITWSGSQLNSGFTLRTLMERRFNQVLEDQVSWDDIFEEDASARMPGRQSKYQHICDRTFLRPRDMIKFCNEILERYKVSTPASKRFDNDCIHKARDAYSEYLLNEIDDEIAKHVPQYKEYIEVIKTVGKEKFDIESFSAALTKRPKVEDNQALTALEYLFDFSIIGYLKPGGREGGSEWVWRYKDSRARFDPNAASFRVHPGFKEVLDLTR